MDLRRFDLQLSGDAVLHADDKLARFVNGQLIAMPLRGRGVELHRIVMLDGRGVMLVNLNRGHDERAGGVADLGVLEPRVGLLGVFSDEARISERRRRLALSVGDDQAVGGLSRCFIGLRQDDGDDLTVVVDLGRLQRLDGGQGRPA